MIRKLRESESGSVAITFGLTSVVLIGVVGVALDYGRAVAGRESLQNAVDAATLAAAHQTEKSDQDKIFAQLVSAEMTSHFGVELIPASVKLSSADNKLTGTAEGMVPLTLARVLGLKDVSIKAEATVNVVPSSLEIALVLDVSSSMIEKGRFDPMKDAADAFILTIAGSATGFKYTKIAIVPFSSRVNFGVQNLGFLLPWGGNPAEPDRWKNPGSYYDSSYTKLTWVDGQNFAMYNGKNYYWMGCAEPRIDFAVHTDEDPDPALTDAPPTSDAFLAMDYNSQSGQSFCPPPITALSDSESTLNEAVDALTSEGSTRLDAGMIAGWYALSPKWKGLWSGSSGPSEYGPSARKIVVFMTDGQMNAQSDSSSKHFDWVCEASSDCNEYANEALGQVCDVMKVEDITIYSVNYDAGATSDFVMGCASGADFFFEANSSGGGNYIETIYKHIAEHILANNPVLVR